MFLKLGQCECADEVVKQAYIDHLQKAVEDELADVLCVLLRVAELKHIDLSQSQEDKIVKIIVIVWDFVLYTLVRVTVIGQ